MRHNARQKKGDDLKEKKTALAKNLMIAQNSTASMGKFDKKAHKQEKVKKVKKKIRKPDFKKGTSEEKNRNLDILRSVTANQ